MCTELRRDVLDFVQQKVQLFVVGNGRFYNNNPFPHKFHFILKPFAEMDTPNRVGFVRVFCLYILCTLTSSLLAGPRCNPNRTFEYFFMNTRHTTYAMVSASLCDCGFLFNFRRVCVCACVHRVYAIILYYYSVPVGSSLCDLC